MGGEEIIEKAKYGDDTLATTRLHNFWVKIEENLQSEKEGLNKLKEYRFLLDGVWRELSGDVERIYKTNPNLSKKIRIKNAILKKKIVLVKNDSQLYIALNHRHEFLKWLQNESGKGTTYEKKMEF